MRGKQRNTQISLSKSQPKKCIATLLRKLLHPSLLLYTFLLCILFSSSSLTDHNLTMATDTLSWADQWGSGGIGAIPEDENPTKKGGQATDSTALGKAKATVAIGAHRLKNGVSKGIKWFKNQLQRKQPPK